MLHKKIRSGTRMRKTKVNISKEWLKSNVYAVAIKTKTIDVIRYWIMFDIFFFIRAWSKKSTLQHNRNVKKYENIWIIGIIAVSNLLDSTFSNSIDQLISP